MRRKRSRASMSAMRMLRRGTIATAIVATSCMPSEKENDRTMTGPPAMAITGVSQYNIVRVGTPMTIDGNLNDWTSIAAIPTFADDPGNGRGALNNTASVKLAWDSTYLYAAYTVTDTEVLAVETTRDASNLYKDDAVELYIDPQGNGGSAPYMATTDYQFIANVRDVLGDLSGNGSGGKTSAFNAANFEAKAVVNGTLNAAGTDVGYTIEMRIKWSDIGVSPTIGHVMQIDPAIDDRDTPNTTTEEFDWANLVTFNNPSAWKEVHLVADTVAPAAPTNPVLTVMSPTRIDVSWTASVSSDVAGYKIYRGTGTPTYHTTVSGSPYQNTGLTPSTSYSYEIAAVDTAGNESAKTTLKTASTPGHGLRVGLFNLASSPSAFGKGPGGDVVGPIYQAAVNVVSAGSINNLIAQADSIDAVIVANLAGSRSGWTDESGGCLNYNAADYEAKIRAFENNATLTDAIARRRVVVYLVDEPNISDFCSTVPPSVVNDMGLLVKSIWPGAITIVRASARHMATNGWAGSGALGSTFWTGVDYGWAQYESDHIPSNNETPSQFYTREKSELAAVNLGMIPGHNIWNGGTATCWDYLNTGSSSGRMHGTFSSATPQASPAQQDSCGTAQNGETRWMSSPAILQASIDAAYNDPDAPIFMGWTHISGNFSPAQATFAALEARSDFVTALDYWLTKAATRTTWNGWRTAK